MAGSFAQQLMALLQPMRYGDSTPIDTYLTGIGDQLFQLVEDWASDTPDGKPGYSLLVDATRVPDIAIPWLGQFVGVQIVVGQSPAVQRAQLTGLANWKRGSVDALQAAPLPWLTGTQTVIIKERDTSPYHLTVETLASETTDATAVQNALMAQKPAGLQLTYINFSGQKAFTMKNSTLKGGDSLK